MEVESWEKDPCLCSGASPKALCHSGWNALWNFVHRSSHAPLPCALPHLMVRARNLPPILVSYSLTEWLPFVATNILSRVVVASFYCCANAYFMSFGPQVFSLHMDGSGPWSGAKVVPRSGVWTLGRRAETWIGHNPKCIIRGNYTHL